MTESDLEHIERALETPVQLITLPAEIVRSLIRGYRELEERKYSGSWDE